jgi:hypothetical protein
VETVPIEALPGTTGIRVNEAEPQPGDGFGGDASTPGTAFPGTPT